MLTEKLSNGWAIPRDGRVALGFTKFGLNCADNWQKDLEAVEQFVSDLANHGAELSIVDKGAGLESPRCRFQLTSKPKIGWGSAGAHSKDTM